MLHAAGGCISDEVRGQGNTTPLVHMVHLHRSMKEAVVSVLRSLFRL